MTWSDVMGVIGDAHLTLGPQASYQWLNAPEHLAMVLARYRAAAALIGDADDVLEIGCGEGIGARILSKSGRVWHGLDTDRDAIEVASAMLPAPQHQAFCLDILDWRVDRHYDAAVALDVIEHLPAEVEDDFMQAIFDSLGVDGVCVIGTPNAAFDHLASAASRAGHINTYTHDRLAVLMRRFFRVVQSFGMQDTSLHLGHPEARHYLVMAGIGPR